MQSAGQGASGAGRGGRDRPLSSKPVGSFVPALVREACRRRGFSNIDIVLRWREIVGPALAEKTWPLRIEWPRRQEAVLRPDGTAAPGAQRTRLVVGAAPACALDVEYAKGDIVERVNRYLGYRATTELVAAPDYTVAPEPDRKTNAAAPAALRNLPPTADDDDPLKAALARLGRGVAGRDY
ncbi:MAG: DUF721 domain-containing protein [Hyphomicrobiaceae bacterium]|nr:DUF721 domain-containing protein [Hyphomicrobiaceae bacterium]